MDPAQSFAYKKRLSHLRVNDRIKLSIYNKIDSVDKLNEEIENILQLIQDAARNATPPPVRHFVAGFTTPKYIVNLKTVKQRLRRIWLRSRDPEDKKEFNKMTHLMNNEMWKVKNERLEKYIKTLDATPASEYSLWKATKHLKRPNTYNPPLFNSKINKWAKSDKQKAELFANHLENVFKPNSLPKAKKEDITIELNQEELLEKEKKHPSLLIWRSQ